ncbi:MAG: restriction endonuclease subunit S [Polyangiaceae bacterium]
MPRLSVSVEDVPRYRLLPGDVIFARTGSVGKCALVKEEDPVCIAGAYFIRLQFAPKRVLPLYAYSVLRSAGVRGIVEAKASRAVQPNFSGPAIRTLPLPVPPLDEQHRFVAVWSRIQRATTVQASTCACTGEMVESLTQRAFSGML